MICPLPPRPPLVEFVAIVYRWAIVYDPAPMVYIGNTEIRIKKTDNILTLAKSEAALECGIISQVWTLWC